MADGNTLFQFLKSFLNETTVGFAEYRRQFDNDNEIAPAAARFTIANQKHLQFKIDCNKLLVYTIVTVLKNVISVHQKMERHELWFDLKILARFSTVLLSFRVTGKLMWKDVIVIIL